MCMCMYTCSIVWKRLSANAWHTYEWMGEKIHFILLCMCVCVIIIIIVMIVEIMCWVYVCIRTYLRWIHSYAFLPQSVRLRLRIWWMNELKSYVFHLGSRIYMILSSLFSLIVIFHTRCHLCRMWINRC